ncbi:NAD(P)-binding domain-containing protein [Acidisoma cellulosilytica]|uniref:NAD(P)-binding domain-containing protein n=1 Tax=Acidisoma cellulosilyticum TaxID=2802395 RepID=A0A963Z1F5_9PROT|nr:NAD(P)-binding domain-containing protein [Acidisoma cellulosilyticum]MCB8880960.1 NAD(P)-binding domain-containing protein [Acidisoma cellulosilyticum]
MAHLGFVGTGTLADAVIRGLQTTAAAEHRYHLSPRSESRSKALVEAFPQNTVREESNAAVVEKSDIVLIGVLPKQIADLGALPFRADQIVVSFLAGVPVAVLRQHVAPATRVVRMIPLPGVEFCKGPILMTPADAAVEDLFGAVGELVIPAQESDLDTISMATGLMSAHFQLQNTVIDWLKSRDIADGVATPFVRALYSGLAELALAAERKGEGLPPQNYETPGGLNETVRAYFNRVGWFDEMTKAMDVVEAHRKTLMKKS